MNLGSLSTGTTKRTDSKAPRAQGQQSRVAERGKGWGRSAIGMWVRIGVTIKIQKTPKRGKRPGCVGAAIRRARTRRRAYAQAESSGLGLGSDKANNFYRDRLAVPTQTPQAPAPMGLCVWGAFYERNLHTRKPRHQPKITAGLLICPTMRLLGLRILRLLLLMRCVA